ncbi:MAG: DnaD domain protein [Firmicutes bacterium]|nr:DnaD domain protein [Bacillota bacterium]
MFVKLSPAKAQNQKLTLDSLFVTDYLPYAPETCVKVYLMGLNLTVNPDNSPEMIAAALNIKPDEVLSAFKYWEDQGIVSMLSLSPPLVEYKEIESVRKRILTYSKAKYKAFNDQLHAMLPGRVFLPAEYNEYYAAIETLHVEPEAMLAVIAYCVRLKGDTIGYPYILTVARNLAAEGCLTFERINERLSEFDLYDGEIKAIIKALGQRRKPDVYDKRCYVKWTKSLGFAAETIVQVAKGIKKGSIERLDAALTRYYEKGALTAYEIEQYETARERCVTLTAAIVRVLGKYYERLDYIIETYTQKWLDYGFSDDALVAIADYCFRNNRRDLESMDAEVTAFYQKGVTTVGGVDEIKAEAVAADIDIRKLLDAAGEQRSISAWDRDYYRTWTYSWKFSLPVVEYAASLARGKGMAYINGILNSWQAKGVSTVEEAKKAGAKSDSPSVSAPTTKTAEELLAGVNTLDIENL